MALQSLEAKYEILAKLDEGGMGTVYKVRHRLLDEVRVIKIIRQSLAADADLQQRFLNEARAAARLRHPNVAQLYDFSMLETGFAHMELEFIDGIEIGTLIKQSGPPELELGVEIAQQSLRALAYLHRKGFVHRDISPDNLMLTEDVEGRRLVKLIDLGIAKDLRREKNLTERGLFIGKVRYASPEHFGGPDGDAEIDPRSDLYSLAIVLYELFTGVFPIRGDSHQTLLAGHLFQPPREFSETDPSGRVPEALRVVLARALAKSPDDRYPDAPAFAEALRAAVPANAEETSTPLGETIVDANATAELARIAVEQGEKIRDARQRTEVLLAEGRLGAAEVELAAIEEQLGTIEACDSLRERLKELRDRVTLLLAEARAAFSQGDLPGASAALVQAGELDAEHAAIGTLRRQIASAEEKRRTRADRAVAEIEGALATGDLRSARTTLERTESELADLVDLGDPRRRLERAEETAARDDELQAVGDEIDAHLASERFDRAERALASAIERFGRLSSLTDRLERSETLRQQSAVRRRVEEERRRRREVDQLVRQAEGLAEASDYRGALDSLERAGERAPDNPQIEALRERYSDALESHAGELARAAARERAATEIQSLLQGGDVAAAEAALERAVLAHGDGVPFPELRVALEKERLQRREKDAARRLQEAYRAAAAGDLDAAAGIGRSILEELPGFVGAEELLADIDQRRAQQSEDRELAERRREIDAALAARDLEAATERLETTAAEYPKADLKALRERLRDARRQVERDLQADAEADAIAEILERHELDDAAERLAEAVRCYGDRPRLATLSAELAEALGRRRALERLGAAQGESGRRGVTPARLGIGLLLVAAIALLLVVRFRTDPALDAEPSSASAAEISRSIAAAELGRFRAVVIGNAAYREGLPLLETPAVDARALGQLLSERYGFEVEILIDATRYEVLSALELAADELTDRDNLLVFYAGHGYLDPTNQRGYWQPVDAEPGNTANWISTSDVSDILLDTEAKRVLVVADSCFSGAFLENDPTPISNPREVDDRLARRARLALTSGGLQPVVDNGATGHSVFAGVLLDILRDNEQAFDTARFFLELRARVAQRAESMGVEQVPGLSTLDADEGGLFPFVPRTGTEPS